MTFLIGLAPLVLPLILERLERYQLVVCSPTNYMVRIEFGGRADKDEAGGNEGDDSLEIATEDSVQRPQRFPTCGSCWR
jgi:hypothetical protein